MKHVPSEKIIGAVCKYCRTYPADLHATDMRGVNIKKVVEADGLMGLPNNGAALILIVVILHDYKGLSMGQAAKEAGFGACSSVHYRMGLWERLPFEEQESHVRAVCDILDIRFRPLDPPMGKDDIESEIQKIIRAVCKYVGIRWGDIFACEMRGIDVTSKLKEGGLMALPKSGAGALLLIASLREFADMSFPGIARVMGCRAHSKVHHRWQHWLSLDPMERSRHLDVIRKEIGFAEMIEATAGHDPCWMICDGGRIITSKGWMQKHPVTFGLDRAMKASKLVPVDGGGLPSDMPTGKALHELIDVLQAKQARRIRLEGHKNSSFRPRHEKAAPSDLKAKATDDTKKQNKRRGARNAQATAKGNGK